MRSTTLVCELRRVLNHLYDWAELRRSPLIAVFGLNEQRDPPASLRHILIEAIGALKPQPGVTAKARAWRTYQLLYSRYVEQFTQREVASELGLSIRHLRRAETMALEVLAAYLVDRYALHERIALLAEPAPPDSTAEASSVLDAASSCRQELEWLQESQPCEAVQVEETVYAAVQQVESLARTARVTLDCRLPDGLPLILVRSMPTRQALLNVLVTAVRCVPGGRVTVRGQMDGPHVSLTFQAIRGASGRDPSVLESRDVERLEMARQLVALSGGTLYHTGWETPRTAILTVRITLPAQERIPVLVIDDNLDTLQLLERYLLNSRYRFFGSADPQAALQLAQQVAPRAIVLDVMLPGLDGWELLGRLQAHPALHGVPIIVCTILPQEELAVSLGAAAFLHKPVTRQALLATLERVLARSGPGCA